MTSDHPNKVVEIRVTVDAELSGLCRGYCECLALRAGAGACVLGDLSEQTAGDSKTGKMRFEGDQDES